MAQPLSKIWDKRFGGTLEDYLQTMSATPDGGFLLGGTSYSGANGDKSQPSQGNADAWVVKIDADGNKLWDKRFGGALEDYLQTMTATSDGGFLLAGSSESMAGGDVSQPSKGGFDYWVIKIDADGNKLWDKRFGGTDDDELRSITPTSGGGFLLGGKSNSGANEDKSQPSQGFGDYWVLKIDGDGNKLWDKRFGGTADDELSSITPTSSGGFLLGGASLSQANGDKSQPSQGQRDYWVVKIDADGNKLWDKRFGGTADDYLQDLTATSDGGFLLAGASESGTGGDKTRSSLGGFDYWVVKIDADGNKLWDKRFGGTEDDILQSLVAASDGGFLLMGASGSENNGDKSQPSQGLSDYWMLKIDADGNKLWDKRFGGTADDYLQDLTATSDGGFLLGGYSQSGANGDKSQPSQGRYDYWVVKISGECALMASITPGTAQIVCSGTTLALGGGSTGGTSPGYAWSSSPAGFSSNQQNPSFSVPTVATTTNYTLTLTVTEGVCMATATVQVTVNPTPNAVATPTAQTICSNANITPIALSGNVAGTVYNWTRDNTASITGIAANGSGNISGSLTNPTNAPVTVTFTITPTANNCPGTPITATVIVNPTPNAVATPTAQTICSNANITPIALSGNVAGTVYNWTRDNTASITGIAGNGSGNISGSLTNTTNAPITVTFTINPTANNCPGTPITATVIVNPLPTATISGTITVCQNAPAPTITFTGNNGTVPYIFTYTMNGEVNPPITTGSSNTLTVPQSTANAGLFTYSLVSVRDGNNCSQNQSGTATVTITSKPIITLNINGQTFNEGNSQTLCDTDTNPNNTLLSSVTTGCVAGPVLWRTQIGAGAWSDWSATAPIAQPSSNIAYKYQAACDPACPSTLSGIITLTINYRASTPQNVSLVADAISVAAGESKTICNIEGNTIAFNATCGAGEILLYSVDGGNFSNAIPSQIVDGNFHNYRVRCRKADNTPSCLETESAVMSLKITTTPATPTATISPLSTCETSVPFSGNSTCAASATLWYNAANDQLLSSLPATTPNATTSFYARCRNDIGCLSEKSNIVTFTFISVNNPPVITVSSEAVCTGTPVTVSANCPEGATTLWNTGVTQSSFQVTFSNVTRQSYSAKCVFPNGCQSPVSAAKEVIWKAFDVTVINIGQSQSGTKPANDRNLWSSQFLMPDAGPSLEKSTQLSPTLYYTENLNKGAPRYWTIQVEPCALGTDGSVTYDLLASPETGMPQSFNTHENNAPYLMYANREGWTELYAQNHPAYGFYQDNGSGGNTYDAGLPKGLYKLGVRYWDQKGQGSIYPSTRQPAGNVLAYQEYWFRIQSKNGIGTGNARTTAATDNGQRRTENGSFAQVAPNPVTNTLRLNVTQAKDQKVNISLVDASGRTLLQRGFVPQTNQHQEQVEVSDLANGMYFLKVNTTEKQATLKVIKVQ